MRPPVFFSLLLLLPFSPACTTDACELDADCGGRALCSDGRCVAVLVPARPQHVDLTDGWDAPLGSGMVFVADELAVMRAGEGLDVDGQCRGEGDCLDNALFKLGELGNDQIRQGLLGGETLLGFEIAGIDDPFYGDDDRVSVKVYGMRDADDPFFPANNFQVPNGYTTCCEFRVNRDALPEPEGTRSRGRARLQGHALESTEPTSLAFLLTIGDPPHPRIELEAVQVRGFLVPRTEEWPNSASENSSPHGDLNLSGVVIGGAVPIQALSRIANPLCKTLSQLCPRPLPDSTILDLVVGVVTQPDIDLDGDGLEQLEVGALGRIVQCLDGDGSVVAPIDRLEPWSCAQRPEMADGFSIALRLHGIPAKVVE